MGNNGFHYYLLFTSPTCRCGAWPDTKQSAGPGLPARVCGCVRLVAGRDGETGICCPGVRRGSRACPPPLAMPGMDSDLQQAGGQGSGRGPRTASIQRLGLYHRPAAPGTGAVLEPWRLKASPPLERSARRCTGLRQGSRGSKSNSCRGTTFCTRNWGRTDKSNIKWWILL